LDEAQSECDEQAVAKKKGDHQGEHAGRGPNEVVQKVDYKFQCLHPLNPLVFYLK